MDDQEQAGKKASPPLPRRKATSRQQMHGYQNERKRRCRARRKHFGRRLDWRRCRWGDRRNVGSFSEPCGDNLGSRRRRRREHQGGGAASAAARNNSAPNWSLSERHMSLSGSGKPSTDDATFVSPVLITDLQM